jgi:hypothetical protein
LGFVRVYHTCSIYRTPWDAEGSWKLTQTSEA